MFKLPISLGIKYFRSSKGSFGSFYSLISILGLMIGVGALIIVLSVMNGFERELQNRILGVVPQLTVKSHTNIDLNNDILFKEINAHPDVIDYAPFIEFQGLIKHQDRSRGIFITGVDPSKENKMSIITEYIIEGNFESLSNTSGIIIGSWLANYLGVSVGDTVSLLTDNFRTSIIGTYPRTLSTEVVGIFDLKAELDQSLTLINHDLAATLIGLPNGYTEGVRIKTQDLFEAENIGIEIISNLPPQFYFTSWKTSQGTLFQAIQLEKRIISLLLFLIVAVASFNILSTIVMTVKAKEREIAILKTLGFNKIQISFVFVSLGLLIASIGILLGLILGLLITSYLNDLVIFFESLMGRGMLDAYFINYFPHEFRLNQILGICIIALFISLIFSIIPSRRAANLKPIDILRYE